LKHEHKNLRGKMMTSCLCAITSLILCLFYLWLGGLAKMICSTPAYQINFKVLKYLSVT